MKSSAQNKVLLTLVIFFFLFCIAFLYWFFFIRSTYLPNSFEYLRDFSIKESNFAYKEKKIQLRGVLYNIEEYDSEVVFDLNVWDGKNGNRSLYFENITLPYDLLESERTWVQKPFFSGELTLYFKFHGLTKVDLRSWKVEDFSFSNSDYDNYINKIYEAIDFSPISNEFTIELDSGKLSLPVTSVYQNEEGKYENVWEGGYKGFYKLWIDSYLYEKCLTSESLSKCKEINLWDDDLSEYLGSYMADYNSATEYYENLRDKSVDSLEADHAETPEILWGNNSMCLLISDILSTEGLVSLENKRDILSQYCSFDTIKAQFAKIKSLEYSSPIRSDYGLVNIEKMVDEKDYSEILPLFDSFNAVRNIYRLGKYSEFQVGQSEDISLKLFTLNSMIWQDKYVFEDLCTLANVSKEVQNYVGADEYYSNNLVEIQTLIENNLKSTLQAFENDVYTSFLCFSSYNNDYMNRLKEVLIQKYIYLNFYDHDDQKGVWNNELNTYDIEDNVALIKMLLEEYE